MAIVWTFTITPIDPVAKIVSVTAVRTDDAPVDPERAYTVSLRNADISTGPKKVEALNILWAKYQQQRTQQAKLDVIADEIAALETSAKVNFEGREP